jgi:hypothetical protein
LIAAVADALSGLSIAMGGDDEEEEEFFEVSAPRGLLKDDADPKYQDKPTQKRYIFIFLYLLVINSKLFIRRPPFNLCHRRHRHRGKQGGRLFMGMRSPGNSKVLKTDDLYETPPKGNGWHFVPNLTF